MTNILIAFLTVFGAGAESVPVLEVPSYTGSVKIDAVLDETCYREFKPITNFVIAGRPDNKAPGTKAWVFWNAQQFIFAFECTDEHIVAKLPSSNEQDVDVQDRAELFIWSGKTEDAYYCMEIAPDGAVDDYKAKFYRQFDRTWSVPGWQYATKRTKTGYIVEAAITREAMARIGFTLKAGEKLRGGLFRGDYQSSAPGAEPVWITWVNAPVPKPDFHIAESFGLFQLK